MADRKKRNPIFGAEIVEKLEFINKQNSVVIKFGLFIYWYSVAKNRKCNFSVSYSKVVRNTSKKSLDIKTLPVNFSSKFIQTIKIY